MALLLLIDQQEKPTDALVEAQYKLRMEYKRQTGDDPPLEGFRVQDLFEDESRTNQFQRMLIERYCALDPDARLLGYHQGRPVLHVYTTPMRFRDSRTKRQVVGISVNGAPFDLPKTTWQDNFIPAHRVTWAEAAAIIEDWFTWGKVSVET